MNTNSDELAEWLIAKCRERDLSWSEASRRAGVSPNTISQIVSGVSPGRVRLTALADFFGMPVVELFRMAGHIPPQVRPDDIPPEIRAKVDAITRIWRELLAMDPESARRLSDIALSQAEMVMAAHRSGLRANAEEEEQARKERTP